MKIGYIRGVISLNTLDSMDAEVVSCVLVFGLEMFGLFRFSLVQKSWVGWFGKVWFGSEMLDLV